jgi:hyperosmotically inducible periplasmic protein
MNTSLCIRLCGSILAALVTMSAFAQNGDTSSSTAAVAVSGPKAARAANRALQKDVVRALSKTKGLRSSAITVRASNGAVTLEGTVPEESQMDLATHAAEAVPGVVSVKNMLTLSTL